MLWPPRITGMQKKGMSEKKFSILNLNLFFNFANQKKNTKFWGTFKSRLTLLSHCCSWNGSVVKHLPGLDPHQGVKWTWHPQSTLLLCIRKPGAIQHSRRMPRLMINREDASASKTLWIHILTFSVSSEITISHREVLWRWLVPKDLHLRLFFFLKKVLESFHSSDHFSWLNTKPEEHHQQGRSVWFISSPSIC